MWGKIRKNFCGKEKDQGQDVKKQKLCPPKIHLSRDNEADIARHDVLKNKKALLDFIGTKKASLQRIEQRQWVIQKKASRDNNSLKEK